MEEVPPSPIPSQEDAEDLGALEERADEPALAFEDVLADLKRRGKV